MDIGAMGSLIQLAAGAVSRLAAEDTETEETSSASDESTETASSQDNSSSGFGNILQSLLGAIFSSSGSSDSAGSGVGQLFNAVA